MKLFIRVLLVLASGSMIVGNWNNGVAAMSASCLFLTANVLALVYNEVKK